MCEIYNSRIRIVEKVLKTRVDNLKYWFSYPKVKMENYFLNFIYFQISINLYTFFVIVKFL